MKMISKVMGVGACALLFSASTMADQITGAGSTAIFPVLSQWAKTYEGNSGVAVNYQSIGSGGGIKQIEAKTVNFGDSDMPLTPDELKKQNMVQFPAVIIGITPIINVPGIKSGQMILDGKALADIYLGKITKWNDKEIKHLNPHLHLPNLKVTVVHRADGSGTTFYFTNYLSKVSKEWKDNIGSNTAVSWPAGVGGKGSAGVASYVKRIKGAIGYDEYAYAMQTNLTWTRMVNKAGKIVSPKPKFFQAASAKDFYAIMTDAPGADSWPLTATTYFLLRKDSSKEVNRSVVKFAKWFLHNGQSQAAKLDYVPLPEATVKLIEAYAKDKLGV
jgi:phosphate transport system substrate-binding protein